MNLFSRSFLRYIFNLSVADDDDDDLTAVQIVQLFAGGRLMIFGPLEHVGVVVLSGAPQHILLHRALLETGAAQVRYPLFLDVSLHLTQIPLVVLEKVGLDVVDGAETLGHPAIAVLVRLLKGVGGVLDEKTRSQGEDDQEDDRHELNE